MKQSFVECLKSVEDDLIFRNNQIKEEIKHCFIFTKTCEYREIVKALKRLNISIIDRNDKLLEFPQFSSNIHLLEDKKLVKEMKLCIDVILNESGFEKFAIFGFEPRDNITTLLDDKVAKGLSDHFFAIYNVDLLNTKRPSLNYYNILGTSASFGLRGININDKNLFGLISFVLERNLDSKNELDKLKITSKQFEQINEGFITEEVEEVKEINYSFGTSIPYRI